MELLRLSAPAYITLELTPSCNNRCPGCSNIFAPGRGDAGARRKPPLPAQQWETWLQGMAPEAVRIRLSGGEPTAHPEFLRILTAAASSAAWVTVFTNGRWRQPHQLVRHLRETRHLAGLLISLHGAGAHTHEAFTGVPGSFAETVRSIRLATENGLQVAISTVITAGNYHELEEIAGLARELEVQHLAINRYIGPPLPGIEPTPSQTRAAVAAIEALIASGAAVQYGNEMPQCFSPNHSRGCLAGVSSVAIGPWGAVYPCISAPESMGSLFEDSLEAIWNGPAMNAWLEHIPSSCASCAALPGCNGGCRAQRSLRPSGDDPCMGRPLDEFEPYQTNIELPAHGRPRIAARLRPEPFGYVLLGDTHILPISPQEYPLVSACDGSATFASLAGRFGPEGLELLGALWEAEMIQVE